MHARVSALAEAPPAAASALGLMALAPVAAAWSALPPVLGASFGVPGTAMLHDGGAGVTARVRVPCSAEQVAQGLGRRREAARGAHRLEPRM